MLNMESIQTAFARGMSCAPQRLVFDVAAPHSLALQPGFSEVMQWFKGKAVMETRKKASGRPSNGCLQGCRPTKANILFASWRFWGGWIMPVLRYMRMMLPKSESSK